MNLKIKLQCFEKANPALKFEYSEYVTSRNFHFNVFHFVGLFFHCKFQWKNKKNKIATASRKFFNKNIQLI